jgi:hypothetical protein
MDDIHTDRLIRCERSRSDPNNYCTFAGHDRSERDNSTAGKYFRTK